VNPEWPLVEVRLIDVDGVEVDFWTGYVVPPLPYPNENPRAPYTLMIGDERHQVPIGPLDGIVWQMLTAYGKEMIA
jgi:hypothetical protein